MGGDRGYERRAWSLRLGAVDQAVCLDLKSSLHARKHDLITFFVFSTSKFTNSKEGKKTEAKLWDEMVAVWRKVGGEEARRALAQ